MFTGLIQYLGRIRTTEKRSFGKRLVVDTSSWEYLPAEGESIAVNGVCLTVVPDSSRDGCACFDVITETLNLTTLGDLVEGSLVNLERSLQTESLLGGHFVQGHVDGVGEFVQINNDPGDYRITIRPPGDLCEYIVPKGSVAIDGVSMTVASVGDGTFTIALIPTTLEMTTLGSARPGMRCNIETDIISRTVVHWLKNYAPTIGMQK